jgi:hypothetical protein
VSLDWALRYAPMVVRARGSQTILEVGSGPQGLAHYLRDAAVVGTDIAFGEAPAPNLRAVIASAEALPFREAAFDIVVSSDMMEHLPEALRIPALREMLRVAARCALVGFPSGDTARRHDRAVERFARRIGIAQPRWLTEHLQHPYPTSAALLRLPPPSGWRARVLRNTNWRVHLAVVLLGLHWRMSRLLRGLDRIGLVALLGPLLNRGETYREIIVLERPDPAQGAVADAA